MQENANPKRKWFIIGGVIILIIILLLLGWLYFAKQGGSGGISGLGIFSTTPGSDDPRPGTGNTPEIPVPNPVTGSEEPFFYQLSQFPVAGGTAVALPDATTEVRFVARENGHIYGTGARGGNERKIANTTIPRIHDAMWLSGSSLLYRYIDDTVVGNDAIKTFYAIFNEQTPSGTPGYVSGSFLPDNILEVAASPDGKQLFYLRTTSNGVSGVLVDTNGTYATEVLQSTFSEWLPYLTQSGIILATKPSSDVPGYAYRYEPRTKGYDPLFTKRKGLTIFPEGKGGRILFSEYVDGQMVFGTHGESTVDEGTLVGSEVTHSVTALPEKCVWSRDDIHIYCGSFAPPSSRYPMPDSWYRGQVELEDTFWRIDTRTGTPDFLADPKIINKSFDATKLFLSPDESMLYFINKTDGTLWGMRIVRPEIPTETYTADETGDAEGSYVGN